MTDERTKRRLVGEDFSEFLSPCPTLSRRATSVQRNGIYVSISRGRASLFDSKRKKETEEEERKKARLLSFRFHSRVKATSKNPRVLSQEARRRERERERVSSRWSNEEKKFPQSEKELRGRKNILRVQSLRIRNEIVLRELFLEKGRIY